jgi:cytochrome c oxidase cbb3-type subunit 3
MPWRLTPCKHAAVLAAACALAACSSPKNAPQTKAAAPSPQHLATKAQAYSGKAVADLVADAAAMQLAGQLYQAHCASCHGPDGQQGKRGAMDLTRGRFNFGASEAAIHKTITDGRQATMPTMGRGTLGSVDLGQLVAYVQYLAPSGDKKNSYYVKRGKMLYDDHCAICHGEDGRGKPEKGAPDLTDDYWQHGESMMNIRLVITRGVQDECPAWQNKLTPTEIDLLTAYVLKLIEPAAGKDATSANTPAAGTTG